MWELSMKNLKQISCGLPEEIPAHISKRIPDKNSEEASEEFIKKKSSKEYVKEIV